jgi:hypothetical protein
MRRPPHDGQKPRRLQLKASSLSWPHSPQRSRRKPWGQDAAFEEGVELVLDEPRQLALGVGLGLVDEAGRMLLHQAVQGGLLGATPLVTQRGVVRRPLGLLADGLHARLPRW